MGAAVSFVPGHLRHWFRPGDHAVRGRRLTSLDHEREWRHSDRPCDDGIHEAHQRAEVLRFVQRTRRLRGGERVSTAQLLVMQQVRER